MKLIINTIILMGSLFFCNFLYANKKLQMDVSSGSVVNLQLNDNLYNNNYSSNFLVKVAFNPMYNLKYLDRFFIGTDYILFNIFDKNIIQAKSYNVDIYYNIIDLAFLTFYIGYDIFGRYNGELYGDNSEIVYFRYKQKAESIGGDFRLKDNIFLFFNYKKIKLSGFTDNILVAKQYSLGIKFKFEIENIKKIKLFGD